MSWVWHVAKTRKMTTGYNISVRKPKVNRNRWEIFIKMDLKVTGWENLDWTNLAVDRDW
jgi:hypothetical protein